MAGRQACLATRAPSSAPTTRCTCAANQDDGGFDACAGRPIVHVFETSPHHPVWVCVLPKAHVRRRFLARTVRVLAPPTRPRPCLDLLVHRCVWAPQVHLLDDARQERLPHEALGSDAQKGPRHGGSRPATHLAVLAPPRAHCAERPPCPFAVVQMGTTAAAPCTVFHRLRLNRLNILLYCHPCGQVYNDAYILHGMCEPVLEPKCA